MIGFGCVSNSLKADDQNGGQAGRERQATHVTHSTAVGASPKAHSKRRINHILPDEISDSNRKMCAISRR
jgi:hypothetical protein